MTPNDFSKGEVVEVCIGGSPVDPKSRWVRARIKKVFSSGIRVRFIDPAPGHQQHVSVKFSQARKMSPDSWTKERAMTPPSLTHRPLATVGDAVQQGQRVSQQALEFDSNEATEGDEEDDEETDVNSDETSQERGTPNQRFTIQHRFMLDEGAVVLTYKGDATYAHVVVNLGDGAELRCVARNLGNGWESSQHHKRVGHSTVAQSVLAIVRSVEMPGLDETLRTVVQDQFLALKIKAEKKAKAQRRRENAKRKEELTGAIARKIQKLDTDALAKIAAILEGAQ